MTYTKIRDKIGKKKGKDYIRLFNWVIGFIEADGCFSNSNEKHNGKIYKRPQLTITQKNKEPLEIIKNFLNMGKIYKRKDGYFSYLIYRKYDVLKLKELFIRNNNVRLKKTRDVLEKL